MSVSKSIALLIFVAIDRYVALCTGLATGPSQSSSTRRDALGWIVGGVCAASSCGVAVPSSVADAVDTEDFLKTGTVAMPMGVSGQGKLRTTCLPTHLGFCFLLTEHRRPETHCLLAFVYDDVAGKGKPETGVVFR